MARLKVFTTQSGFYDLAVAVPSQAAALGAWGIRQNLFAEGMAQITSDKAVVAAALAKPGVVLKRPLGGKGAFSEDAALPEARATKPNTKKRHDLAARKAVVAAEDALDAAEKAHGARRDALREERDAIDAKIAVGDTEWTAQRRELQQARDRARKALEGR